MREIKFRAWEKNLKGIFSIRNIDFHERMINKDGAWRFFDEIELMQYTGLKDKNGREIYEGDVVKGYYYEKGKEHRFIGQVKFIMGCFKVVGINKYLGMNQELNPLYEPIGNIYENPELLNEVN